MFFFFCFFSILVVVKLRKSRVPSCTILILRASHSIILVVRTYYVHTLRMSGNSLLLVPMWRIFRVHAYRACLCARARICTILNNRLCVSLTVVVRIGLEKKGSKMNVDYFSFFFFASFFSVFIFRVCGILLHIMTPPLPMRSAEDV